MKREYVWSSLGPYFNDSYDMLNGLLDLINEASGDQVSIAHSQAVNLKDEMAGINLHEVEPRYQVKLFLQSQEHTLQGMGLESEKGKPCTPAHQYEY